MLLNLLKKEFSESRGGFAVGMLIFIIVPLAYEILLIVMDPGLHQTLPLMGSLFTILCCLYAMILGSHIVCRDWGTDAETFLLAQPVSRFQVVRAKFLTGLIQLIAIGTIIWTIESSFERYDLFPRGASVRDWTFDGNPTIAATIIPLSLLGYYVTFALALFTRKLLTSIFLTFLMALTWLIAPLLNKHLVVLHPRWILENDIRGTVGAPFFIFFGCAMVFAWAVIRIGSRSEKIYSLSPKLLTYLVAGVVLCLFGLSFQEKGESLIFRSEASLASKNEGRDQQISHLFHKDRDFYFISEDSSNHNHFPKNIGTFRIDDKGKVSDLSLYPFPYLPFGKTEDKTPSTQGKQSAGKKGSLYYIRNFYKNKNENLVIDWLVETTVEKPNGNILIEERFLEHLEVDLMGKVLMRARFLYENNETTSYIKYITSERFCYKTYRLKNSSNTFIEVYDLSNSINPHPKLSFSIPFNTFVRVVNNKLILQKVHALEQLYWICDADQPDQIKNATGNFTSDIRSIQSLRYISSTYGLFILTNDPSDPSPILGRSIASPLSWPSRFNNVHRWNTQNPDNSSIVIESVNRTSILYDVSNPHHPQRVGFLTSRYFPMLVADKFVILNTDQKIEIYEIPKKEVVHD